VIVPTRFVARVCRDSGVTSPVEVVPEGVDPAVYSYQERPQRDTLTTLIVAMVNERKHTREAITAWKQAFANRPDARLLIKSRFQLGNYVPDDARITLVDTNEPSRGIPHLYREADILLQLGSEGFGLPLVEGMATGLPAVALVSEGQADVFEDAPDCLLPVEPARWQPADDTHWGPAGIRGVPDIEQAAEQLRRLADHPTSRREMGRRASAWALSNRNIWNKGPAILDVMEHYVRPPRPLRRTPLLWAPVPDGSLLDPVADLVAALEGVGVTIEEPDLRRARVAHVFQREGAIDDERLTRLVLRARQRRVPVAITEQAVGRSARAWERDAAALVSTSAPGAETLRRNWPAQRIEHIPYGCPPWSDAQRRQRTQVIGTFAERPPCLWRLLDVLGAVQGTELLVLTGASNDPGEAWLERVRHQPVRNVEVRSPRDAATRLAAEADVAVLWYEETETAATSYAACIALASGVPVLTSATTWFADVAAATYQPARLVDGVRRLLEDTSLRRQVTGVARDYCHDMSWPRIAERHLALWRDLEQS
jgi:glycosyltransferase involved in cell wall biosynthesis